MQERLGGNRLLRCRLWKMCTAGIALLMVSAFGAATAQAQAGGEANLKLPDLSSVSFFGINGHALLLWGLLFCVFGLIFGMTIYKRLKNLPVHRSMREISELILRDLQNLPDHAGQIPFPSLGLHCRFGYRAVFLRSC